MSSPTAELLAKRMLAAIGMSNMASFVVSRPEVDRMAEVMLPLVTAAVRVHEAHQRTLREHSTAAHFSADMAWDALATALKDLG